MTATSSSDPASPPDVLETADGRRLAHRRTLPSPARADRVGVVFLGGFRSDMTGTKALWLEQWAASSGRAFVRFDYTGHGVSSGRFEEGCIGDWARDAEDVLDHATVGPQVLVGSSMGGWIATLLARRRPDRLAGLVGIAAAPDFTEDLMWAQFSEAERAQIMEQGALVRPSPYDPDGDRITRRLIEDGRDNFVLRAPLMITAPVRLLHGDRDEDVPLDVAHRFLAHVDAPDARLTILKGSDHRMSEPRDLAALTATLEELLATIEGGVGAAGGAVEGERA